MKLNYLHTLVLVALLAACSTNDEPTDVEFDTTGAQLVARSGTVIAEYDRHGNGTTVHAQFVNATGVSREQALEALEVWTPDTELAVGACSLRSTQGVGTDVSLQLLDIGPLSVGFEGARAQLEGRRLPDMLQGISGVVYGNEEGFDLDSVYIPYAQGAAYGFAAPGGDGAGGFDVEVVAPMVPEIQAIGTQRLPELGSKNIVHEAGEELTVSWLADHDGESLYLDIESAQGLSSPRLRCHIEDDGGFSIPGPIIEQLRGASTTLELTLRRVNQTAVNIEGLDTSEVIFAAKEHATLLVVP